MQRIRIHCLKLKKPYFDDVMDDKKRFLVRMNSLGYHVGDRLVLREWNMGRYTGRYIEKEVIYVYSGGLGLEDGYVVLGIDDGEPLGDNVIKALLDEKTDFLFL